MRSVKQKEAGREIAKLEKQWYAQCAKNIAIDADIQRMELEIARLEAEQGKGVDGAAAASAGKKRKCGGGGARGGGQGGGARGGGQGGGGGGPEEEKTSPSPTRKTNAEELQGLRGEGAAAGVAREEIAEGVGQANAEELQGEQVMIPRTAFTCSPAVERKN